jgi:Transposase domain (DUF772)
VDALRTISFYPKRGQPALAPWRLALVTALQFLEHLSDRQAAEAVRSRIDWKYALGLELTDAGFHFSALAEFRARLVVGRSEHLLLDTRPAGRAPDQRIQEQRIGARPSGRESRTRCMRGFKSFAAAERFCRGYDELRDFLRPRTRHNQPVPACRRRLLHFRRATTTLAILEVA